MKRTTILFAVIALLLGFGPLPRGATFVQPAFAEGHEGGGGGGKEEGKKPEFEYIKMDPISLPIITAKGLTQQLSLMVSLEVPYAEKDKVATYKPRLTDAYIQDLYGALGAGFALMKGNVVDVVAVKQRLTSVTAQVLGPDLKANSVLLQVIQQRAM